MMKNYSVNRMKIWGIKSYHNYLEIYEKPYLTRRVYYLRVRDFG